jgi:hypothetical protein
MSWLRITALLSVACWASAWQTGLLRWVGPLLYGVAGACALSVHFFRSGACGEDPFLTLIAWLGLFPFARAIAAPHGTLGGALAFGEMFWVGHITMFAGAFLLDRYDAASRRWQKPGRAP